MCTKLQFKMMDDETPIQKFYAGSHVFITGGTGFLGKVLIEKLLRSCPVDTIYLLIRDKKGVDPKNRLETLFSDKLFERLKTEKPNFIEKLEVVPGDCADPYLGISPAVYELLSEKVNIVFHSAATIKFNDNLKKACAINVIGTKHVLEFCRTMKNLKSVIYVSTAYSHCHLDKIEERFYDPPLINDKIEKLCEILSEEEIDILTPNLLQKWPNTYTLTKAVAEEKIKLLGVDLPVSIFRPAIVTPSFKEPVPGWTDNVNGPTGVFVNSWLGVQKTMRADKNANSNIVPADYTANALIMIAKASYDTYRTQPGQIKIYGFESNSVNPLTWDAITNGMVYWSRFFPSNHAVSKSFLIYIKSKIGYAIVRTLYEIIPGYFIDLFSKATGKKARMNRLYKMIHSSVDNFAYFTTKSINYDSKNMEELFDQCTNEDKNLFFCDLKQIDWSEYLKNYTLGIRKYLMKEPEDTIEKAKIRQKNLFWIYVASRIVFFLILAWIMRTIFRYV